MRRAHWWWPTTPGPRRCIARSWNWVPTWRCTPPPSTSGAIPTCCWASSSATKPRARPCIGCGPTWESPLRRTTVSWVYGACARWLSASRATRTMRSPWPPGCAGNPRLRRCCTRPCRALAATRCGSGTLPAQPGCSGSCCIRYPSLRSPRCSRVLKSSPWDIAGGASKAWPFQFAARVCAASRRSTSQAPC